MGVKEAEQDFRTKLGSVSRKDTIWIPTSSGLWSHLFSLAIAHMCVCLFAYLFIYSHQLFQRDFIKGLVECATY